MRTSKTSDIHQIQDHMWKWPVSYFFYFIKKLELYLKKKITYIVDSRLFAGWTQPKCGKVRTYLEKFRFYLECEIHITTVRAVLGSCSNEEKLSHSDKPSLIRASTGPPPLFTYLQTPSQLKTSSPFKSKASWNQFKVDLQEFGPGNLCNLCVFERRESKIPACVSVKRMIRHAWTAVLTPLSRFLSEGGQRTLQIEEQ